MLNNRFFPFMFVLGIIFSMALPVSAARPAGEFLLWTGSAPGALGSEPVDRPTLTPYYAAQTNATGAAIIVCPGGGYSFLSSLYEGKYFAQWLNERGISAFVLKYRLGPAGYHHPVQLLDAQRAIRYVRAHAVEWELDPNRVGIIGASAGGHLASTAMVHFDEGNPGSLDPVEHVSCRPDLGILCYPVITMLDPYTHAGSRDNLLGEEITNSVLAEYLSTELQVSSNTPPAFLMHTEADAKVPYQNSTMFADALASNAVPFELHLYPSGGHGVGLGSTPGDRANYHPWVSECEYWLFQAGFALPHLGNIWLLGDSITDGAAVPAWVPGGYRDALYTNLVARGHSFRFVGTRDNNSSTRLTAANQQWHDGWSGFTLIDIEGRSGLYDEVEAWHASIPKPDIILLKIGINDLNHDWEIATAPARLNLLVDRLFTLNPGVRLMISSLLDAAQNNPYRGNPAATNDISASVIDYNAAMAAMVSARRALGQNIVFVDMHIGLSLSDLSDGLHPNAGGYVKMGGIWADALEAPPDFTTNAITVAGGMVSVTATGTVGAGYSFRGSSDLTADAWIPLTNDYVRANPVTLSVPATNTHQCYRFEGP